ncbi:hypothetical protein DPMN_170375 [Dreissena polymorpha]|uniref:Uncharacterized protein n=1 Tax=Dreissena polymorpha TaxID=45954 RepID=A0A9D4DZN6_DREPO|nr:hypothetical protein DPMN_170375 [Dreissena polymorpha]
MKDVQRVVHFLLNIAESIWVSYPAAPRGSGMIGALSCSQSSELCRAFGIDCLH